MREVFPVTVMTFNVRYAAGDAGTGHAWERRRAGVVAAIRAHAPDLVGCQEVLPVQYAFLERALPGYGAVGVGRGGTPESDEAAPVFFRATRFDIVSRGTFWLSETPDHPGSVGWGAALPRVCSFVQVRDRATGGKLFHYNTHLSHCSARARLQGARLLKNHMRAHTLGVPVLLTGDFNEGPAGPLYQYLAGRAPPIDEAPHFHDAHAMARPGQPEDQVTFHGFHGRRAGDGRRHRLDWILVTPNISVRAYAIDARARTGCYPSDHFPVVAETAVPAIPGSADS